MTKLKVLLLFFLFKYCVTSPLCVIDLENTENCHIDNDVFPAQECPAGQSLISRNDIEEMIDEVLKRFNITNDIIDSYNEKAVAINNKYLAELNEFQKRAEMKQHHLTHILENIENMHQILEPLVQNVTKKLEKIDTQSKQLESLEKKLEEFLKKFKIYQEVCKIKNKNPEFIHKLRYKEDMVTLNTNASSNATCGNIEAINSLIMTQLQHFRDEFSKKILRIIEFDDINYGEAVASYNDRIKEGALKQHDKLMYDILELQDDIYHLNEDLNDLNISEKLNAIEVNIKKVELLIMAMETDIEEYGKKFMNSNEKLRSRRDVVAVNTDVGNGLSIVNNLIRDRTADILMKNIVKVANIFKELNDRLENPAIIESYINKLKPNEEYVDGIKRAQEGLNELKKLAPSSSIKKLQNVYDRSIEVLQKANKAKEDIDVQVNNEKK